LTNDSTFAVVATTINNPSAALLKILDYANDSEFPVIIVGDSKTPETWENTDFHFLSLSEQHKIFGEIAGLIPIKSYSRKNLGYLQAKSFATEWIYETDDDNFPMESPFISRPLFVKSMIYKSESIWLNVYEAFGYTSSEVKPQLIWPRGFDLRNLRSKFFILDERTVSSPIQQGIADGDPDVDAIYRLVLGNFIKFNVQKPIALDKFQICPTNTQSTWWHKSVQQLMYLPSTCTFRLTDILRGFVAWRILQERDETITFHSPIVFQDRNEHDILENFEDEVELYLYSGAIINDLISLNIRNLNFSQQLVVCYQVLKSNGVITDSEFEILEAWNSFFISD
jgi:hypothetical protein